jgi:hypothetical protein
MFHLPRRGYIFKKAKFLPTLLFVPFFFSCYKMDFCKSALGSSVLLRKFIVNYLVMRSPQPRRSTESPTGASFSVPQCLPCDAVCDCAGLANHKFSKQKATLSYGAWLLCAPHPPPSSKHCSGQASVQLFDCGSRKRGNPPALWVFLLPAPYSAATWESPTCQKILRGQWNWFHLELKAGSWGDVAHLEKRHGFGVRTGVLCASHKLPWTQLLVCEAGRMIAIPWVLQFQCVPKCTC